MVGTMLAGRYELGRQLGRGGMATVYEARDDLLDRAVAVKVLRVHDQGTARQRFAAEARNAASLTHPHAVAVYDVNTTSDQPFIVMELVLGDTLEDVLHRDGHLEAEHAVAVGSQVLAALHTAHRRGLVHRDVKPANILLPDGVVPTRPDQLPGVKLADFGIAKAMHDATVGLTMVGQVIGTPKYLSPEQVKGERATPRSDLYATAVVLYEMLAGRPPFEHDSAVGLALAHREDEPPPLAAARPDVDPTLVALVHRTLSKDPDERPADANEMRAALLRNARMPNGTQLLPEPDASTMAVGVGAPAPHAPAPHTPTAAAGGERPRRRWPLQWLWALIISAVLTVAVLLGVQRLSEAPPTDEPTAQEQEPADPEADQQAPVGAGGQDQPQDDPADAEQQPDEEPEPSAPPADDEAVPETPDDAPTG